MPEGCSVAGVCGAQQEWLCYRGTIMWEDSGKMAKYYANREIGVPGLAGGGSGFGGLGGFAVLADQSD